MALREMSLGIHYNVGPDLLNFVTDLQALTPVDGFQTGPGFGAKIDEAALREANKTPHRWHNPIRRTADGRFAEC